MQHLQVFVFYVPFGVLHEDPVRSDFEVHYHPDQMYLHCLVLGARLAGQILMFSLNLSWMVTVDNPPCYFLFA